MSSPVNRTALREEEEPALPGQPAGQRQRGDWADPIQPRRQHLRASEMPGGIPQLMAQRAQPGLDGGEHVQGGGDLQLPARGQVRGRGRPQRGQALLGAQRALAQRRGALVEEDRVDALYPGGVLAARRSW